MPDRAELERLGRLLGQAWDHYGAQVMLDGGKCTHGNLYFHERGQRILDILIVRDTTTQTRAGEPFFELVSDNGLVFILDGSVLGICKSGAFMQDIIISPAASPDTLVPG